MLSDPAGNPASSHRSLWDSSPVEMAPSVPVRIRRHKGAPTPTPRSQRPHCLSCTYPGFGVSPSPGPGSELPGSWRSWAAPPWPQQCLGSPGADRWSWNEAAPRSCGRSCRCGCRRCWGAGKLETHWQSDRAINQTCNSLITALCSITINNF